MGSKEPSYQVVFVFGKRLDRDRVTRELAERVDFVLDKVENEDWGPDAIFFSGGGNEATAAMDYLLSQAGWSEGFERLGEASGLIKVDGKQILLSAKSEAQNTVANFDDIPRELYHWNINPQDAKVFWVTTKYHVKHLLYVHDTISHASLIQPVKDQVAAIQEVPVDYPKYENPLDLWKAKLYQIAYRMTPLWVELFRKDGCIQQNKLTPAELKLFEDAPGKDGWVRPSLDLGKSDVPQRLHKLLEARDSPCLKTLDFVQEKLEKFGEKLDKGPEQFPYEIEQVKCGVEFSLDVLHRVCEFCRNRQGKLGDRSVGRQVTGTCEYAMKAIRELQSETDPDTAIQA